MRPGRSRVLGVLAPDELLPTSAQSVGSQTSLILGVSFC